MRFFKTLEELNIDYENEIKNAHLKYESKHRKLDLSKVKWYYTFNDTLKAKENPTLKDVRLRGELKRKNIIEIPVKFIPQNVFDYILDLKKKKEDFEALPESEKIKKNIEFFENFRNLFTKKEK